MRSSSNHQIPIYPCYCAQNAEQKVNKQEPRCCKETARCSVFFYAQYLSHCYLLQQLRKVKAAPAVIYQVKADWMRNTNTMAHVFWNSVHNDPSRSSKVVDFGTNRKRVYDFLLVLNSNLSAILPRFRDIKAFIRRLPLFPDPTPIPAKISGVFPCSP